VADDSPICLSVMENLMREFNLFENCEFFASGEFLFERAARIIEDCHNAHQNSDISDPQPVAHDKKTIKPVDLMILDYQMPRMNGLEIIQRIRTKIKALNRRSQVMQG
jgi:CheY-like chemotaxis protein